MVKGQLTTVKEPHVTTSSPLLAIFSTEFDKFPQQFVSTQLFQVLQL